LHAAEYWLLNKTWPEISSFEKFVQIAFLPEPFNAPQTILVYNHASTSPDVRIIPASRFPVNT
jgi:hypothetical protein